MNTRSRLRKLTGNGMCCRCIIYVVVLCALLTTGVSAAQKYSYIDLVNKLTDLEGLAVLPEIGEKCGLCSSYDRSSRYDETTGKYVAWGANSDHTGIVRMEGDKEVLAEIEGPGCIWRIWSATAKDGHVRIYLDGATEPVVDLPFIGYFNRENPPFVYPSLVYTAAKGFNCYVPIPFAKSCKIVADKGWGSYYQFSYSTYPKGTVVPTFTRNLSKSETAALEEVDTFLTNQLGSDRAGKRRGEICISPIVRVQPGNTAKVAALFGPKAITCIRVLGNPAKYSKTVLRNVALDIYWDNEKNPSVSVPLGDFFGTGPGYNPYKSLPLGMTDEGFYSFWYMPFAKSARVELVNDGRESFSGQLQITTAPLTKPMSELAYFHAKWHRDELLPSDPDRRPDWTIVKTRGRGRFCGVMLEVWNPKAQWWGEGDEKFFIDDEKFPSIFGTGSEDYFGYAWTWYELFQHAYHNQTICEGNHQGHISNNRWHIADNIPFQTAFEGYIEKYFPNERPTLYACTAYWYLAPGGQDPHLLATDRADWYVQPPVYKVQDAVEGEELRVLDMTAGYTVVQNTLWLGDRWSNWHDLFWGKAEPGDKLTLAVDINTSGKYELKAQFTHGPAYGRFQLALDGVALAEPIDLYNSVWEPAGEVSLGVHEIGKGEHKLAVEFVGANEKSTGRSFGLDYIKLAPID